MQKQQALEAVHIFFTGGLAVKHILPNDYRDVHAPKKVGPFIYFNFTLYSGCLYSNMFEAQLWKKYRGMAAPTRQTLHLTSPPPRTTTLVGLCLKPV